MAMTSAAMSAKHCDRIQRERTMANVASDQPARTSAGSATQAIVTFARNLRWDCLERDVHHAAKRHLLDTVGVMIAGAGGGVANHAEAVLGAIRGRGNIPVPGR